MSVHVYVRTCVDGVFKISYGTIGPTEMRAIIMLVNTAIFFAPKFFLTEVMSGLKPFDFIGIGLAVGLATAFLIASSKQAIVLAKEGK